MLIKTINKIKSIVSDSRTGGSLKARVARGGMWLGIGNGVEQLLRLIRNIILTRILAPEAFGVMAIILAVNMFFEAFTEIGIKEAVIQNPNGADKKYLNGAWWLASARSVLLYTILFIASPFIADFYNNPELTLLLRISLLCILFRGFMSAQAYVAVKKMEFKKWISIEQLGGVCGITTAIILSFYLRNVWALVIGFMVEGAARFLLSYIICPFIPRLEFKKEYTLALIHFARDMFGLPILTFIFLRIDVFVIGKIRTTEELGFYSMALALASVPALIFSKFVGPVLMPAFSEMQNDHPRINRNLLRINLIAGSIGIPLIVFVLLFGRDILTLVYTPQYAQVALPFGILFTVKMMVNFSVPIVAVYIALGRPALHRLFTLIRAFLIILLIYPAVKYFGLTGGTVALLIAMSISLVFQVGKIKTITDLNIRRFLLQYLKASVPVFPIIIVYCLSASYFKLSSLLNLLSGSVSLIISYLLAYMNIRRDNSISNI